MRRLPTGRFLRARSSSGGDPGEGLDQRGDPLLGALQAVPGPGAVLLHGRLDPAAALPQLAREPVAGAADAGPGPAARARPAPLEPGQFALDAGLHAVQLPVRTLPRSERPDDLRDPIGDREGGAHVHVNLALGGVPRVGDAAGPGL